MKATVIVPAFEEQGYLEESLRSLHDQTRPIDEIMVVDSHSQDQTASIASEYADTVVQAPPGKLKARNKGAEKASGDVLLWADADRRYPPEWSQKLLRHFSGQDGVVGVGGTNQRLDNSVFGLAESMIASFVGPTASIISGGYWLDGGSSATLKSAYQQAGGMKESWDGQNIQKVWLEEEVFFPRRLAKHGDVYYDRSVSSRHEPRRLKAMLDPDDQSSYANQVRSGDRF